MKLLVALILVFLEMVYEIVSCTYLSFPSHGLRDCQLHLFQIPQSWLAKLLVNFFLISLFWVSKTVGCMNFQLPQSFDCLFSFPCLDQEDCKLPVFQFPSCLLKGLFHFSFLGRLIVSCLFSFPSHGLQDWFFDDFKYYLLIAFLPEHTRLCITRLLSACLFSFASLLIDPCYLIQRIFPYRMLRSRSASILVNLSYTVYRYTVEPYSIRCFVPDPDRFLPAYPLEPYLILRYRSRSGMIFFR